VSRREAAIFRRRDAVLDSLPRETELVVEGLASVFARLGVLRSTQSKSRIPRFHVFRRLS
jgi:hypothetical protein